MARQPRRHDADDGTQQRFGPRLLVCALALVGLAVILGPTDGDHPAPATTDEPMPPTLTEVGAEPDDDWASGALDSDSRLLVVIFADDDEGLSGVGSDHVIRAMAWDERIGVDDLDEPRQCHVGLEIPVDGLRADHDDDRAWVGLEGEKGDWERGRVESDMRGDDQLQADSYPNIYIESTACEVDDAGQWRSRLEVTVRGQTAQYDVPLNVDFDGDRFSVDAQFEAVHADFGMEPYSALFGSLQNGEEIYFEIDASGYWERRAGDAPQDQGQRSLGMESGRL